MDKQLTKVYVTKYALSDGPFGVEAEISYGGSMAFWGRDGYSQSAYGKDFWLTPEEAITDCERRRKAKLESIAKQVKKLEVMTFTIKE